MKVNHYIGKLTTGGGTNYIVNLIKGLPNFEHKFIYRQQSKNFPTFRLDESLIYNEELHSKHLFEKCIHHFHGFNFFKEIIFKRLINPRCTIILQIHGYIPSEEKGGFKKYLAKKLEKLCYKCSSEVIFLSKSEKKRLNLDSKRDHIIPTGINKTSYVMPKPNQEEVLRLVSLGVKNVYQKGIDKIFLLSHKLNSVGVKNQITLYFDGATEQENMAIAVLEKTFINSNCIIKSPIHDVWKEIIKENFHGLISLSRFEGMPLTLLEAVENSCDIYANLSSGHEYFSDLSNFHLISEDQLFSSESNFLYLNNKPIRREKNADFRKMHNYKVTLDEIRNIYEKYE